MTAQERHKRTAIRFKSWLIQNKDTLSTMTNKKLARERTINTFDAIADAEYNKIIVENSLKKVKAVKKVNKI